jgi:hypothetical protein
MPLFGRRHRRLLGGLAIALLARTVQQPLEVAHQVEHVLGLSLVPAVVVLTVDLILYRLAKSGEAKAAGETAEPRGQQSQTTASETARLAAYGQMLDRRRIKLRSAFA